jgi:hypothetical protein
MASQRGSLFRRCPDVIRRRTGWRLLGLWWNLLLFDFFFDRSVLSDARRRSLGWRHEMEGLLRI